MTNKTTAISSTQLPDPRDTDLVRTQKYEEFVQGAWQAANGNQKQLEALNGLLQIERENNEHYKNLIAEYERKNPNALLSGKRKEIIAVLNAMYEMFCDKSVCSKQEFFTQQAKAWGDDGLRAYSIQLTHIQQTQKYESVFEDLMQTALTYREKCDND